MIALIQRVTSASVRIDGQIVAEIEQGILAFVGVEKSDNVANAERLLARILGYRIFSDSDSQMTSGKLAFEDNGKVFNVALLRLSAAISKEAIMNIWKRKAGIDKNRTLTEDTFRSKHQQLWTLIPLSGEKLDILVAMHTGKTSHTLVRLADNKTLPDSAVTQFKHFLKNAQITKP